MKDKNIKIKFKLENENNMSDVEHQPENNECSNLVNTITSNDDVSNINSSDMNNKLPDNDQIHTRKLENNKLNTVEINMPNDGQNINGVVSTATKWKMDEDVKIKQVASNKKEDKSLDSKSENDGSKSNKSNIQHLKQVDATNIIKGDDPRTKNNGSYQLKYPRP